MIPADEYIETKRQRHHRRLNRMAHHRPDLLDALLQRWAHQARKPAPQRFRATTLRTKGAP